MAISRTIIMFCIIGLAFTQCKNGDSEIGKTTEKTNSNAFKGGNKVARIAELSMPVSIFPHKITTITEGLIAGQIFEGLVKIDPKTLKVMPGLAESWEISENGKIITFNLRKGVNFHKTPALDNKEIEFTSKDAQFTFELLCTESASNLHFATVCKDRILGANETYEASKTGKKLPITGIKIIDDYTFTIELLNSPSIFLDIIGNPVAGIISKEAYGVEKENSKVGAGPFIYDGLNSKPNRYALYKNVDYYGKDSKGVSLPYLDSIMVGVVESSEIAWTGFKNGAFDYIGTIPANQLKQIVEENIGSFKGNPAQYVLERNAEMITQYYLFNIHKPPFDNVKVRKAFNYAIDRDRLIDRVLFGQAFGPAINGIVPPTFEFYKSSEVQGYNFDIAKAKKLLAEAGYPNGKNFPPIQLVVNSGNARNNTVAAEIQKQIMMNLNVNLNFESLPQADKFSLQTSGQGNMFRDAWVADYASPESFLSVFYGEPVSSDLSKISFPNTIKFVNAAYDENYKKGRDATNRDSAAVYFLKAEKILMEEAPLIPLYYESNYRLVSSRLLNFYVNPLRHFDFTEVSVRE